MSSQLVDSLLQKRELGCLFHLFHFIYFCCIEKRTITCRSLPYSSAVHWTFVPPQNPNCQVRVLEGSTFGRWSGHRGRALRSGVSAFMKEVQEWSLAPATVCSCSEKSVCEEAGPHQQLNQQAPWTWASWAPDLWEVNIWFASPSAYDILLQ